MPDEAKPQKKKKKKGKEGDGNWAGENPTFL